MKPSDLKKLKRSKSAAKLGTTSFPSAPTSIPLSKSKSSETTSFTDPKYPYTSLISQQQAIEKLTKESQAKSETISLLRKKIASLETQSEPTNLTELDNSLLKRHQNLKAWFSQYQKTKKLDKELAENIDEASNELISQDEIITNLRKENKQLKKAKEGLEQDLKLTTKLAELRKDNNLPANNSNSIYWKPLVFLAVATITLYFLMKNN